MDSMTYKGLEDVVVEEEVVGSSGLIHDLLREESA
jgi:hypothetical protein